MKYAVSQGIVVRTNLIIGFPGETRELVMETVELVKQIKGYDTTSIKSQGGFTVLFFVTVLQKNKEVYECQEYQTLDIDMQTIDMSIVCRELIQPYNRGIGT